MLDKHERRSLEEIENRLAEEDPELARGLAEGTPRSAWRGISPLLVLAAVAMALSVTLLVLAEFGAALLAAVLAGSAVLVRMWRLRGR
ncbi:DUF3040 domain-containing protein [Actinopolyspora mortivallis]|uniref:DUF3040 domain-containing protein n=1 Tax=Actinopolyspora mortivallis TaxID=33906 RepID=A0A2T0GY17_ACTMO|nr:DUF3040 domain-containing protein [Actinopolyspora mortivallis]PRW63990.1 DUF3040 domain-containing protein [Actinopolyspora mortivallis]